MIGGADCSIFLYALMIAALAGFAVYHICEVRWYESENARLVKELERMRRGR